eukprot:scaffold5554_cov51-Skeletonema_menzelii.AAC.1
MGSTSHAMRTREAFFSSTRVVTCFNPNFNWQGTLAGASFPAAVAAAVSLIRCFLAAAVSG